MPEESDDLDVSLDEAMEEMTGEVAAPAPEGDALRPEDLIRPEDEGPALRPEDILPPEPRRRRLDDDGDTLDAANPLGAMGLTSERTVPILEKPWMKHHVFHLIQTPEEVEALVDRAIADGRCSLDLEAEGLDTRVYEDPETGKLRTVHQVVGFCIAVGDAKEGYYIPIRHRPDDGGRDLNVKPVERVLAAITRLCQAAQPTPMPDESDLLGFRRHLEPPKVVIDFWNAAYDQEMLYPLTGIDWWHPDSFEDGQLAFFVIYSDDKNLGLKDKAPATLRDPDGNPYEMIKFDALFTRGRAPRFDTLSPDEPSLKNYACADAICTRLLGAHPECVVKAKGDQKYAWAYRLEKQVAQVKRVMERNRVKVNRAKARELLEQAEAASDEYRRKIVEMAEAKGFAEFEPGSPKQLSAFLFEPGGLDITLTGMAPEEAKDFPGGKPQKNKSDQYKTDADTLAAVEKILGVDAPPVLQWVLAYREQEKLIGTYLQSMVNNGDQSDEFRFQFKQTGAATGRFSAPSGEAEQGFGGIPIHGIPATSDLRTCFEARPGYLMVKCDFAGEELRIVTNLSNEPVWVKEFLEGEGDLHTITARAFFSKQEVTKEERKAGKIANFALVYGGGPAAVQRAVGCDKLEARRKKDAFDKALPIFAQWCKKQHDRVKIDRGVYTAFGRWIAIPDAAVQEGDYQYFDRVTRKYMLDRDKAQGVRAACERHATNYPIQGTGADIMKIAMILVHKECFKRGWLKTNGGDDSVRMLLTVHDELVFEIKPHRLLEALDVITENMEMPWKMARPPFSPPWKVPLVTDPLVGTTWAAETGARRAKPGEVANAEKGEVKGGHFIFKKPPEWLKAILTEHGGDGEGSGSPPPANPLPGVPAPSSPPPAAPPPPRAEVRPDPPPPPAGTRLLTVVLKETTRRAIPRVAALCTEFRDDQGALLRIVGPMGDVLVDPALGIRVHSERFVWALNRDNWSTGAHTLE